MGSGTAQERRGIEPLLGWLRDHAIFDARGYSLAVLRRRLVAHVAAAGATDLTTYVARHQHRPADLASLKQSLLGASKGFGDDADAWRLLAKHLRDRPPTRGDGARLRIWCAGCGSGEEVYALAILLAEAFGWLSARRLFELLGTDVDDAGLARSAAAVYPRDRVALFPERLVEKHFRSAVGGLRVVAHVRALARFERHDLLRDRPKPGMGVVVCRDVLGAFNARGRKRALACLLDSLDAGGVLLAGRGEHFALDSDELVPCDPRYRVFERRRLHGGVA